MFTYKEVSKKIIMQYIFIASKKCYDNVGCFSNAWPFWNTFGILPRSPEENGITFHLYTRINPTNDQVLDPNGSWTSVMSTNFNGAHKTVFIIHGFNGKKENNWIELMKSALIQYVSKVDKLMCNYLVTFFLMH